MEDLQKQETTYEYDTSNNLTKVIQNNKAKMTYTYDSYHNVKTATTQEGLAYSFEYDTYGNNTKVSISDGTYTMSSSAAYTNSGNTLSTTTDALGNITKYGYNANTNVLEWVQYPEDTTETRTSYTYDSMYRLASAACTTDTGTALAANYTYTDDLLTSIQTGSTTYNFTYGDFGVRTAVKAGTRTLASYIYNARDYTLFRLDYGNGDKVQYTYDKKGRVTKETYEDGATVTYQYDNNGALAMVTDSETGIKTTYYYDLTDRVMKYVESGTGYGHSVGYEYDTLNNLTSLVETINGVSHTTSYVYDDDNRVASVTNEGKTKNYVYDDLGRIDAETITLASGTTNRIFYGYKSASNSAVSAQPIYYSIQLGATPALTYRYTYDKNGNILTENFNSYQFSTVYTYDSANQLIREDNIHNYITTVWTYDDAGNILSRTRYPYTNDTLEGATPIDTVTYTYGNSNWGDLLTGYDGRTFTYDTVGNLLSDGTWTYTWKHGRQLATLSDGTTTWQYTYNADGLRTKKTDGTTTYSYVYNGGQLTQMTVGADTLYFSYDATGRPMTVTFNGAIYHYILSLQGDVLFILDDSGNYVAGYVYDAWGNIIGGTFSSAIGTLNPLRYRGYVYDQETGLYYLQSRYYNPEIGRFINADAYISTGQGFVGNNMFVYCLNNPVNRSDPFGFVSIWYYLVVDYDMGYIHRMVQLHISSKYKDIETEVSLYGFGRADIVQPTMGYVWEIKHAGIDPARRVAEATVQATSYIGGNGQTGKIVALGPAYKFSGFFHVQCLDAYCRVEYYTPSPGVVLYTVKDLSGNGLREHAPSSVFNYTLKKAGNTQKKTALGVVSAFGAGLMLTGIGNSRGGYMNSFKQISNYFN